MSTTNETSEREAFEAWWATGGGRAKLESWRAWQAAHALHPTSSEPVQGVSDACEWHLADEDFGVWDSACGESWSFVDGGPKENGVRFCQGCGKPTHIAARSAQGNGGEG